MVTLITRFDAKDTTAAVEIGGLLRELSDKVRSEPGYQSYQVLSGEGAPHSFWVLESWDTQQDVDRHSALVVTSGTADRAAPLLSSPMTTMSVLPI